jgi:PAS domain S-box-containing protein
MGKLIEFWSLITNLGITNDVSVPNGKRIKISNQLAFISILITFFYCIIYAYWNFISVLYIQLIFTLGYISILLISKFGFPYLSKRLFVLFLNLHLFSLSLFFGEDSQAYLLFIPVSVVPLVLFDFRSTKTFIWFVAFSLFLYAFLMFFNFDSALAMHISKDYLHIMKIAFNITAVLCEIIVIYSFISNYDRAEKKLDESNILLEEQFKSIFDTSFDALFLIEYIERRVIKANRRAVELFEMENENEFYNPEGLDFRKEKMSKKDYLAIKEDLFLKGFHENEVIYKTKKGNYFWGALAIRIINIGEKQYQSVRITDITSQKEFEKNIKNALNEKEILLSEIHHRVKNNLAVISGLLGLQSSYVEDEKAKELFEESRNRIHSMALIHDKLYQHETFAKINLAEYINDLVHYIKSSYIPANLKIEFTVTCNDIFLDIKNAVPIGLILNELISNSCKHAYKGRTNGEIKIVCTKMGEKFTMMVSDDGIGFDISEGLENPKSLGLTLIKALSEQIGSSTKTTFDKGTAYYISFEA